MKKPIDYYIFVDYSERLVGYLIIQKESLATLLPKISKLKHYKEVKHKKAYIQSIKKIFENNRIGENLLKYKSKQLKDNLTIFVEIIDFIKTHKNFIIFVSIDNNQFTLFQKLLDLVLHKDHIILIKESNLKRGSVEYKLSLIIDTKLNIERVSK